MSDGYEAVLCELQLVASAGEPIEFAAARVEGHRRVQTVRAAADVRVQGPTGPFSKQGLYMQQSGILRPSVSCVPKIASCCGASESYVLIWTNSLSETSETLAAQGPQKSPGTCFTVEIFSKTS